MVEHVFVRSGIFCSSSWEKYMFTLDMFFLGGRLSMWGYEWKSNAHVYIKKQADRFNLSNLVWCEVLTVCVKSWLYLSEVILQWSYFID